MLSRAFAQLLVSSLVTNPTAPASIDATRAARPVFVALRPLVNGPAFLPLHVQLATTADSDHGNAPPPDEYVAYDFLPADPTAAATLTSLLSGRAVAGRIRVRAVPGALGSHWRLLGFTERTAAEMTMFAESQPSALSLLDNSCWAFAAGLVDFCEISSRDVQDT